MADETLNGGKAKFVAAAGGRPEPKGDREETTERYECLRCDTTQVESKSLRHKAKVIRCRECGNTVYPVTVAPEKTKAAAKYCKVCHAKLRRGNSTLLCSLCDR